MAGFVVSIAFAILCLSSSSSTYALNDGFSVELIHRDSPKSPFYNPQETLSQRIANAFNRSINRVNHFTKTNSVSTQQAQSRVYPYGGEYLMSISLGTPSFNILAIADTGSDLTWTQCQPCSWPRCYSQTAPLFDPRASSTYRELSCYSYPCHYLPKASCGYDNVCLYSYFYADRSYTYGYLATETITLDATTGSSVQLPTTVIGCGYNNHGSFNEKEAGIIGLGAGPLSLVSQMGSSIDGKFSYCLVPYSQNGYSSKISFGSDAIVSGEGVQSTPLYTKYSFPFYLLTLEAISVGDQKVYYPDTTHGNIYIDSGTTFTAFPQQFLNDLSYVVASVVQGRRVEDPSGHFGLCYEAASNINLPKMTVHFTGADVILNPINTFLPISEGVICLAFLPAPGGAVFGNVAHANFLVGYDLKGKTVSFLPTDCTKA